MNKTYSAKKANECMCCGSYLQISHHESNSTRNNIKLHIHASGLLPKISKLDLEKKNIFYQVA